MNSFLSLRLKRTGPTPVSSSSLSFFAWDSAATLASAFAFAAANSSSLRFLRRASSASSSASRSFLASAAFSSSSVNVEMWGEEEKRGGGEQKEERKPNRESLLSFPLLFPSPKCTCPASVSLPRPWQQPRRPEDRLCARFEGGQYHPEDGKGYDQGHGCQDHVSDPIFEEKPSEPG